MTGTSVRSRGGGMCRTAVEVIFVSIVSLLAGSWLVCSSLAYDFRGAGPVTAPFRGAPAMKNIGTRIPTTYLPAELKKFEETPVIRSPRIVVTGRVRLGPSVKVLACRELVCKGGALIETSGPLGVKAVSLEGRLMIRTLDSGYRVKTKDYIGWRLPGFRADGVQRPQKGPRCEAPGAGMRAGKGGDGLSRSSGPDVDAATLSLIGAMGRDNENLIFPSGVEAPPVSISVGKYKPGAVVSIQAKGARGLPGAFGGRGGDGMDGPNGGDGGRGGYPCGMGGKGGKGAEGGDGGLGGEGGTGGRGGRGGRVNFFLPRGASLPFRPAVSLEGGAGGDGGRGGDGGAAGQGGLEGRRGEDAPGPEDVVIYHGRLLVRKKDRKPEAKEHRKRAWDGDQGRPGHDGAAGRWGGSGQAARRYYNLDESAIDANVAPVSR